MPNSPACHRFNNNEELCNKVFGCEFNNNVCVNKENFVGSSDNKFTNNQLNLVDYFSYE